MNHLTSAEHPNSRSVRKFPGQCRSEGSRVRRTGTYYDQDQIELANL